MCFQEVCMSPSFLEEQKQFFLETLYELQKVFKTPFHVDDVTSGDQMDLFAQERERMKLLKFRKRNWYYLQKIKKSLRKIEDGEYGFCEECGAKISKERLKARPTADFCIHCKEDQENRENQTWNKPDNIVPFPGKSASEIKEKLEIVH